MAFCASALPPLGTGGRRFSRSKAERFASMDFAELSSTPIQSSGSPTPRPLWLRLRRVVTFCSSIFLAPFCYFGIATTLFRVAICAPCFFDRHFCYLLPSRLH